MSTSKEQAPELFEKDIRIMCEQSSIPNALVDIAVSDPDKLDELEKAAEG